MFAPKVAKPTSNKAGTSFPKQPSPLSGLAAGSSAASGNEQPQRLQRVPLWAIPVGRVQPKLAVGRADDPLEHEADRMADRVMSMPAASPPDRRAGLRPK